MPHANQQNKTTKNDEEVHLVKVLHRNTADRSDSDVSPPSLCPHAWSYHPPSFRLFVSLVSSFVRAYFPGASADCVIAIIPRSFHGDRWSIFLLSVQV